jgi:hypothetical protein
VQDVVRGAPHSDAPRVVRLCAARRSATHAFVTRCAACLVEGQHGVVQVRESRGVVFRQVLGFHLRTWTCACGCVCAHVEMLATALLLVIVVFVLCTDVGCVRGCTMLMFTEQWMNISDVSRGIEMRAFLFWPGALSPERSACIQIRSSACVRFS